MNHKKATYALLFLLFGIAVIYVKSALALHTGNVADYNKSTYPLILGGLLFVLIIVDAVQSYKEEAQRIAMTNLVFLIGTVGIIALYIYIWSMFGYFYPLTFVVLLTLLTLYHKELKKIKIWLINCVVALAVTISIYYVFGTLLHINFL